MLICSLLYFQPSNETFKSMLQEIQEKIPNRDGADQGFLTSHYNDLLDRPLFHPPADGSRLTGLYRLPLGYQMDAVYYCKYQDNLFEHIWNWIPVVCPWKGFLSKVTQILRAYHS